MSLRKDESNVGQDKLRDLKRKLTLEEEGLLYAGNQYCDPIRKSDLLPIVKGGIVAGNGVAAMHYIGMWSMRINADVTWDAGIIVLSIIIAMAVATVGLCLLCFVRGPMTQLITVRVFHPSLSFSASFHSLFLSLHLQACVIGVAVCSMYVYMFSISLVFCFITHSFFHFICRHYTGMYAMEVRNVCVIGTEGCDPFGGDSVVLSPRVLFITFTISVMSYFLTLTGRIRVLQQRYGMLLLIGFIRFQLDKITGDDAPTNENEMHAERENVLDALIASFQGIKAGDLSAFLSTDFERQIKDLSRKYSRASVRSKATSDRDATSVRSNKSMANANRVSAWDAPDSVVDRLTAENEERSEERDEQKVDV